jgi:hypothetical protein
MDEAGLRAAARPDRGLPGGSGQPVIHRYTLIHPDRDLSHSSYPQARGANSPSRPDSRSTIQYHIPGASLNDGAASLSVRAKASPPPQPDAAADRPQPAYRLPEQLPEKFLGADEHGEPEHDRNEQAQSDHQSAVGDDEELWNWIGRTAEFWLALG